MIESAAFCHACANPVTKTEPEIKPAERDPFGRVSNALGCVAFLAILALVVGVSYWHAQTDKQESPEITKANQRIAELNKDIEKGKKHLKELNFLLELQKEKDPAKRAEMKTKFQSENPDWIPPRLALLASNGHSEYGYYTVEGQVRNVSTEPLHNVTVVANWYDSNDGFVKSADAIIAYDPILPGQTSPFKTITSGNPAMKLYRVEFKELMGGQIDYEDLRRKK